MKVEIDFIQKPCVESLTQRRPLKEPGKCVSS